MANNEDNKPYLQLESVQFTKMNPNYLISKLNTFRPNVSTTPLRQWCFRQCLTFSWTTLRGKHCRHPIAVMGVVDMFGFYVQNDPHFVGISWD